MEGDYQVGGGWGCHVSWFDTKQFEKWDGTGNQTFTVWGHHPKIPKVGQSLVGEFKDSFIKFRFVSVEPQGNPRDMFFAEVRPSKQELKALDKHPESGSTKE